MKKREEERECTTKRQTERVIDRDRGRDDKRLRGIEKERCVRERCQEIERD